MRPLLLFLIALFGCSGEGSARPEMKRGPLVFPVETKVVESRNVDFEVAAVGSVMAFERVRVTARVAGVVEKVRFNEGETVKEGQTLAEIEPARFSTAVTSAKATLERAEASEAEAQAGLTRREQATAASPGLITGEELETWKTKVRVAAAEAAQAKAALEQAQLNLRDAYLRAPLAGVIQTKTVETGQYLQPGDVVATLVRRDPLLLRFQAPERDAQRLAHGMTATFTVQTDQAEHSAKITHVAESADATTRMVAVTAEVDGATAEALRPGVFANVKVKVGSRQDAVLIPQAAIRPSERGFLAFVVEDGKAHERVLELGMRTGDGFVEAKSGLKAGEVLVVRGVEPLKEGAPVRVAGEK
jgi:membrane fusion protein, multidrug efflux system